MSILPPVLHVKRNKAGATQWLGLTTQHILAELDRDSLGANEIVTRLADILFIHAVRAYFNDNVDAA